MKNSKLYLIIYYLLFVLISFLNVKILFPLEDFEYRFNGEDSCYYILLGINVLMIFLFNLLLIKNRKVNNVNILLPLIFFAFVICMSCVALLFDSIYIEWFGGSLQYGYYMLFVLSVYVMFNLYSVLSVLKKRENICVNNNNVL